MEPDARTRSAALRVAAGRAGRSRCHWQPRRWQIAAVALQPGKYGSTKVHAENAENAEKSRGSLPPGLRVSA